uniref:Uncharacterized protein n=1 Tax=Cacopsylla melanoneura TaxID=428564 RepID=A0A8D8TUD9_9HEMI
MTSVLSNISELPLDPEQPSCSRNVDVVVLEERGTVNVITDKLVAALDKCQVSDREAVHLLITTAEALGHDPSTLAINRTTIQRRRQEIREKIALEIKERFANVELNNIVVHWDGKLLPSITGKTLEERLPQSL